MRSFVQAPFILFLAASAASATSNVKITSNGPASVTDFQKLQVTVTVTNKGQNAVKLLRHPDGPMSNAPTNKWDIKNEQNSRPEFAGIKAKYVPRTAVLARQFTVLQPGQSVVTKYDLSAAYDFSSLKPGQYTFQPNSELYEVNDFGNVIPFSAETAGHATRLASNSAKYSTRSIAKFSLVKKSSQDIGFNNCTDDQQSLIAAAVPEAVKYIYASYNYLTGISSGTPRYTTWFGEYDNGRKDLVQSHFEKIGDSPKSVTYDCSSCSKTMDHSDDVFAYVDPNDSSTINLCGAFWNAPLTGSDSKAGTIVHESTHFVKYAGTDDIAYGEEDCKQLAQNSPDKAVMNADSHEYFAENTPALD